MFKSQPVATEVNKYNQNKSKYKIPVFSQTIQLYELIIHNIYRVWPYKSILY